MKTRAEIENLKRNWLGDPSWDIEDTEGFEEHREELRLYRENINLEYELAWVTKKNKRILEMHSNLGVNTALAKHLIALEDTIEGFIKCTEKRLAKVEGNDEGQS